MGEFLWTTDKSTYSYFESICTLDYNVRSIDNRIIGVSKCVGYCRFEEHRVFLTRELRKKHNCIKKNCYYYVPKKTSRFTRC